VVWTPIIRQVSQEVFYACGLGPYCPNTKLWPVGNEKLRHSLSVYDELLVAEDLLHVAQWTPSLLWKEELHIVSHVSEEVSLASI
jgi:hypothetical protein